MGVTVDGVWIVYLFLAAFPGIIIVAAVYKYFEVRRASDWPSAPGRIMVSKSEVREVRKGGVDNDDTEKRTFARVEYDYTIAGRKYRGKRVSIGEDLGNFEVAETLARYPVGKEVTVYYNPNDRSEALIERDAPPGIWKAIVIMVLVMIALIVGAIIGFGQLGRFIGGTISNPGQAPFVTACLGFAALAALIIYGIQKNAAKQRGWPVVKGRVVSSEARSFNDYDAHRNRWRMMYRSDVAYTYNVAGVDYTGDKIGSAVVSASNPAFVGRFASRYTPGSPVDVHYNPDNPAEAILKPGGPALLLLWLVPLAMLVLAYVTSR